MSACTSSGHCRYTSTMFVLPHLSHYSDSRTCSKTVGDIFTWLMCFHQLTAAAMIFFIPGRHRSLWNMQIQSCRHTFSLRVTMTGLSACRRVANQQMIGLSLTCLCMPSSSLHSHDGIISAAKAAGWTKQALNALGSGCSHFFFHGGYPCLIPW